MVTVELLYFEGCQNAESYMPRLRQLIAGASGGCDFLIRRISDERQAHEQRFLGSPSVRVNGRDVQPGADERVDYGMACRLYVTDGGLGGAPTDDWVSRAIEAEMAEPMPGPAPHVDQVAD